MSSSWGKSIWFSKQQNKLWWKLLFDEKRARAFKNDGNTLMLNKKLSTCKFNSISDIANDKNLCILLNHDNLQLEAFPLILIYNSCLDQ